MLQAEWTMGIIGGVSAVARGGDIQSGILFGVTAGAIGGLGLGAMGTLPAAEAGAAHVWGAMAKGAVLGTATGATTGYAGGKGDIQTTLFCAAIGNITGATINGIGAAIKAANPAVQKVTDISEGTGGKSSEEVISDVNTSEIKAPSSGDLRTPGTGPTPPLNDKAYNNLMIDYSKGMYGIARIKYKSPFSYAGVAAAVALFAVKAIALAGGAITAVATRKPKAGVWAYGIIDASLRQYLFGSTDIPGTYGILNTNPTPAY